MTTYQFHFRASVSSGTGPHPGSIFLRIIHRRKSLSVTRGYKVYPEEWDEKRHTLVYPVAESPRIQGLTEVGAAMRNDLQKLSSITRYLEKRGYYSVQDVVDEFRRDTREATLLMFVNRLAVELERQGRVRTARAYQTCCNGLLRFARENDIFLKDINANLVTNYERWLRSTGKALNTISFYMRNLRSVYNKGLKDHLIFMRGENPFAGVYTGVSATRKRALTREEMVLLNSLDFDVNGEDGLVANDRSADPTPEKIPDISENIKQSDECKPVLKKRYRISLAMFLFCFHARGMSFVDMAYLKKENISNGRMCYYRKKTGQLLEVRVNKAMRDIINFFARETAGSPYVFPIIRDAAGNHRLQYESGLRLQNRRLKKLAELAGIGKSITTHVARHSWATMAKRAQVPLWMISEGLGHSNERTTYAYLASFENAEIDRVSDKVSNFIKKAS